MDKMLAGLYAGFKDRQAGHPPIYTRAKLGEYGAMYKTRPDHMTYIRSYIEGYEK